ncbi:MAG TPA: glycoside hydrolase domain-containing protein, partial [Pyrinomonadaceae bacterium]|nr:glycoside hydrolase domain-containing protein [Pyrinomonadaceae bacterium]
MSAWYVLSASGFYEVTPGSPLYTFGSPLFPEVKYHLENGKTFIVRARNVSPDNFYIKSAKWNGVDYKAIYITHADLIKGGVLEFEMTNVPSDTFDIFPRVENKIDSVAVPIIDGGSLIFSGKTTVKLGTVSHNSTIFYTTDGSVPSEKSNKYSEPFTVSESTKVKAIAIGSSGARSIISEAVFNKRPNDWTVQIFSKYNRQYTGGGDEGLIDGLRGTVNFASGEWQGYQGQDFVAVVDLQRPTEIRELGGGFLQNARSWIWMPTSVEFEISDDNQTWRKAADIKTDVAPDDMTPSIRDYTQTIPPTRARYVRVTARTPGKIPAWHPGAGG